MAARVESDDFAERDEPSKFDQRSRTDAPISLTSPGGGSPVVAGHGGPIRIVLRPEGATPMSADFFHAALGVMFTTVWLMVGQILAADH